MPSLSAQQSFLQDAHCMPSEDSYILSPPPPSITLTVERDVVSFCRDGRLANIARALAQMVQTV